jgi:hypothetical protein
LWPENEGSEVEYPALESKDLTTCCFGQRRCGTPPNIRDDTPLDTESEIIQVPHPAKNRMEPLNINTDAAIIGWLGTKKRRETRKMEEEKDDADWLFFQSMLRDLKPLDSRRKRALKVKFLLLLKEQLDESDKELLS